VKPLNWYKELSASKGRLEAGAFLLEGPRAIDQVSKSSPGSILEILYTGDPPSGYGGYALRSLTPAQMKSISSTVISQGIAAVVQLPDDTYADELPLETGTRILVLEDIQDPGNVGTLIRTAAAFDYSGIILTDKCADPFSPKCVQSTAGSILSLWIRRTASYLDLVDRLTARGYILTATDLHGQTGPSILKEHDRLVLALGNEAAGLSELLIKKSDYRVRIPVTGTKAESLNVAACGAICMYLSSIK
jgi:TrmH family RNA methyltransferase